jgi:putative transcriptional regulator
MTTILNNRLREQRLHRGLTQEALADMVSVTRQTIIAIEKAKFTPSVKLAIELALVLRVSVEEMFWLEKSPQNADHERTRS